jgi:hypothetical protein
VLEAPVLKRDTITTMRTAKAYLAVAICILASTSCDFSQLQKDKEASVGGPGYPIAIGSFAEVVIEDRCITGGKISLCGTEEVTEQLLFQSSDPSVIELVDASTLLICIGLPS